VGLLDRLLKRGAPKTPAEMDDLVLRQLASLGADLARPRHVLHFLYFTSEQAARDAAAVVEQASWEATVTPPDAQVEQWSLRAESHRVVGPETVAAFRAWFEQVAADFGGEYDGWEAASSP